MSLKEIYMEAKTIIEEELIKDDIQTLKLSNIKLMKKFEKLGITKLQLTSLGNSISLGYSKESTISLLDRNDSLENIADRYDIQLKKYTIATNSNYNNTYNWLIDNINVRELDIINASKMNEDYDNIQEIIQKVDPSLANIVIYNGCNLRRKNTISGLNKDLFILDGVLQRIEYSNRKKGTNTQIYVSGIPNIRIFNKAISKKAKLYSCANYVKPVECDTLNNLELNFNYNDQQYRKYNNQIIDSINDNYLFTQALIDIDRSHYMKEDVVATTNKWLIILKENHCNLKQFKKLLIEQKSREVMEKKNEYKKMKLHQKIEEDKKKREFQKIKQAKKRKK